MENGGSAEERWRFEANERLTLAGAVTIRGVLNMVMGTLNGNDTRPVIPLGHGDPSAFPSVRTSPFAEDAVCAAVRSAKFNGYSSTVGIPAALSAVAEYLSKDLPYKLSPDDVFLTLGCTQALEAVVTVLARPGANIDQAFLTTRPRLAFLVLKSVTLILSRNKIGKWIWLQWKLWPMKIQLQWSL